MGRPRKHESGLPECLYLRNSSYYFVKNGRWHNLGPDKTIAVARVESRDVAEVEGKESLKRFTMKLLARSRSNAKARGHEFSLTKADVEAMLKASRWRCMVTNTPFSMETLERTSYMPFAPSIDRIDSTRGYSRENCRLVCVAANFAMNCWGDKVLRRLLSHFKRPRSFGRPLDSGENAIAIQ